MTTPPTPTIEITPTILARWLATRTLQQIVELQKELAKEGITINIETASFYYTPEDI